MFELLDFLSFLKTRASVLRGGATRLRELVEDAGFDAWKYNVTESLLAGIPSAILAVIVSAAFNIEGPDEHAANLEERFMAVLENSLVVLQGWVLPFSVLALAFCLAFLFAKGAGGVRGQTPAERRFARRAYLIAEGSYGLRAQALLLAGFAVLFPVGLHMEGSGGADFDTIETWTRQDYALGTCLVLGYAATVVGLVLMFWENAIFVPMRVASICGYEAGSGLRRRIAAHFFLAGWGGAIIASGGWAIAYLLSGAWASIVVGLHWLVAGPSSDF